MNKYIAIALAIVTISSVAFLGLWRNEVLDHKATKESLKAAQSTIKSHEENIKIAEETNNEYQADIDRLNADVKRLRAVPAKCVPVATAPGVHPEKGSGGGHAPENGISSGWLYEYAIEAENIRIERNACRNFVNQVWEARQ